jgi:Flp pilus assembly protein TadG
MNFIARVTGLLCLGSWARNQIGLARTFIQRFDERGSSVVELALCLPILLTIITGIATFGIALNHYIMLTNAVEIGARQLAISRGQVTDPCSTISTTIGNASPLLQSSSISYTFVINGTSYPGTSCAPGAAQLIEGVAAQVQATYPCTLKIYGKNLVPSCTLQAQTTELVQ